MPYELAAHVYEPTHSDHASSTFGALTSIRGMSQSVAFMHKETTYLEGSYPIIERAHSEITTMFLITMYNDYGNNSTKHIEMAQVFG